MELKIMQNSLQSLFPKVAAEWHPTKNDLSPSDVVAGSHKKYWFLCIKGHEWQTTLDHRTHGRGCPYCANKKVCYDNCLQILFPEIAAEWHPIKNGNLTPKDVIAGSHKKYWFLCIKGHEWESTLHNRIHGCGCPCCINKKVCNDNCLQTLFPKIAMEWHPTKNNNLTPKDVIAGGAIKYWFLCIKGHEWQATLCNRIRKESGCPYCSNYRVCNDNCLQTLFPKVAAEWHPTKNDNLTPKDVVAGSNIKYWFLCNKKHEWKAALNDRTYGKRGCPTCSASKGEKAITEALKKLEISYKPQHRFRSCKNKNPLPFDFVIAINKKIAAIEYQGEQHHVPIKQFGGSISFQYTKRNDWLKKKWCKDHKIPLLEINYWEINEVEKLIVEFIALVEEN